MHTVKLFYKNCHLRSFSARVLSCTQTQRGWAVTLDATAFYPEGGGQACDLGTLGGVRVLDVQEQEEQILHYCDAPLTEGQVVEGQIDWERRFDLMQQHSGEHIVSGLVHSMLGHHNVGFHVGSDRMEIDFDGPITPQELAIIERKANEAVWQNLPIQCYYPSREALPTIFYRTKKALPWPVRLVQIEGVDSCACCGVHVEKTGEIGLIKLISCVKFHQGVRIELVCGGRAYQYMTRIFEENRAVSQAFSAPMDATGVAAQRASEALSAEKFRSAGLLSRLFGHIADSYAGQRNVVHFEEGLDSAQVRALADKLVGVTGGYCAVFSGVDGQLCYCLASRELDLRQMNKDMLSALDGRGGGKPDFQQGSVRATRQQAMDYFAQLA